MTPPCNACDCCVPLNADDLCGLCASSMVEVRLHTDHPLPCRDPFVADIVYQHAAPIVAERDAYEAALRELEASRGDDAWCARFDELARAVQALRDTSVFEPDNERQANVVRAMVDAYFRHDQANAAPATAAIVSERDRWAARVKDLEAHLAAVRDLAAAPSRDVGGSLRAVGHLLTELRAEVASLKKRIELRWGHGE